MSSRGIRDPHRKHFANFLKERILRPFLHSTNPDEKDDTGRTGLHYAADMGDMEAARQLNSSGELIQLSLEIRCFFEKKVNKESINESRVVALRSLHF